MTRHTPAGSQQPVTLPPIPGLSIDTDRSETAPRQPIICRGKRRGVYGAALRQAHAPIINARIQAIREVLEADE